MLVGRKRKLVPGNIEKLKPYVAGKTIAEVVEEYNLPRISKLASNENRLGCSSAVKGAVNRALENIQDYPDPIARELSVKLAEKLGVEPDRILLASGSESIITILCRTFLEPDDEIITANATFVKIFVDAAIQNVRLRKIPVTSDYRFDLSSVVDSISEDTKIIYIAKPNNPTGTYVTQSEFRKFMDEVPEDVLVIMDEAYYEFAISADDYPRTLDFENHNLIVLRTFSKAYGLAGFRIGYGIAAKELIHEMMKVKMVFEPATPAQAAAVAALVDQNFLERTRSMVYRNRQRLYNFFERFGVTYVESAGNFVMAVFQTPELAAGITDEMLKKGVILRRVDGFGLPNCIRITIGTDEEMQHFEESFEDIYPRIIKS